MSLNSIIDAAFNVLDSLSGESENGYANDTLFEPSNNFSYNKTNSETVIQGQNNAFIVLGRDRPAGERSGYGGEGHSKCGTIDIVAGRLSNVDATSLSGPVNSNTGADAARVYISQKTDVDDNYNLSPGVTGISKARSAVAIKADDIRIIARNSLKIVTNTDNTLSNGALSTNGTGIQLIANNEKDKNKIQPMVKGKNLIDGLTELSQKVDAINGTLKRFIVAQTKYNAEIAKHTHRSPFFAESTFFGEVLMTAGPQIVTFATADLEQECVKHSSNLNTWRGRYLNNGPKQITSAFHWLN